MPGLPAALDYLRARILTGKLSGSYSPTGESKFFFTMMAVFAELEAGHHPRAHHGRPGC